MKTRALLAVSCLLFAAACASDPASVKDTVLDKARQWFAAASNETVRLDDDAFQMVHLRSGETAYLVGAVFEDRSRNAKASTLLVRPDTQEAREVQRIIRKFHVEDFNGDGVSEVLADTHARWGGWDGGTWSIIQFDGWELVILHQAEYFETDAAWEAVGLIHECIDTTWRFHARGNATCLAEQTRVQKDEQTSEVTAAYLFQRSGVAPMDFGECESWPARKDLSTDLVAEKE